MAPIIAPNLRVITASVVVAAVAALTTNNNASDVIAVTTIAVVVEACQKVRFAVGKGFLHFQHHK